MTEADAIRLSTDGPVTESRLADDLKRIGVSSGKALLVHASLNSMGWVCGGPVAVIHAPEAVLGSHGALIMPAHS